MLKILNAMNGCTYRFPISKEQGYVSGGRVAQLTSDSEVEMFNGIGWPVGIIMEDAKINNYIGPSDFGFGEENTNLASVWMRGGVFATDQYEIGLEYKCCELLYVSDIGKLTTRKNKYCVGQVITFLGGVLEFELFHDAHCCQVHAIFN